MYSLSRMKQSANKSKIRKREEKKIYRNSTENRINSMNASNQLFHILNLWISVFLSQRASLIFYTIEIESNAGREKNWTKSDMNRINEHIEAQLIQCIYFRKSCSFILVLYAATALFPQNFIECISTNFPFWLIVPW